MKVMKYPKLTFLVCKYRMSTIISIRTCGSNRTWFDLTLAENLGEISWGIMNVLHYFVKRQCVLVHAFWTSHTLVLILWSCPFLIIGGRLTIIRIGLQLDLIPGSLLLTVLDCWSVPCVLDSVIVVAVRLASLGISFFTRILIQLLLNIQRLRSNARAILVA